MSDEEDKISENDMLTLRAIEVLDLLEIDTRQTNINHMAVLLEAFSLFVQRNALYGDLWRQYGAADSLLHMRSKLARAEITHQKFNTEVESGVGDEDLIDSPLDLINYSVFYIRNVRGS